MTQPDTIHIGRRHGIDWNCYREPGETDAQWQARAAVMRAAFLATASK